MELVGNEDGQVDQKIGEDFENDEKYRYTTMDRKKKDYYKDSLAC